jgi:hypothetical protein
MSSWIDCMADRESPSIGAVRIRLQAPHAGLADYRRLQRLLVLSHLQKRKYMVVGLLFGVPIGLVIAVASLYWRFWAIGDMEFGFGRGAPSIILEDAPFWIALGVVFVAGFVLARIDAMTVYKMLTKRMHAASMQTVPRSILLIGDDGLQTILNGVAWTIPWSTVSSVHTGDSASFVLFNRDLTGIAISHDTFASVDERAACLAFLQSKAPTA